MRRSPSRNRVREIRSSELYGWAAVLAVIALIAALLGFGGIAGAFADLALIVFAIALVMTAVFLFLGWKAAKKVF